MTKKPRDLKGEKLTAYRRGFHDGNEGNYFPGGLIQEAYDLGYKDGQEHGDRKGKPWSLEELKALAKKP
jgi:flagellar biosynthesis/type III secretory pathway protein FliH